MDKGWHKYSKNNRYLSIIVLKKQPGFKYLSKNGFKYEHIGI